MAKTDQLIINIWLKSNLISTQNFKSLLNELKITKTIPSVNELITKLQIPPAEQQVVTEIITSVKEFSDNNNKKHATLSIALTQLKEDLERIEQNITKLPQFKSKESVVDRIPIIWKTNITHLSLNKKQEKAYAIFTILYNNITISSFKFAESLYPILIQQQREYFSKYFKKYEFYLNFKKELLKDPKIEDELEKIHLAYETQDINKPYSFIKYITDFHNCLSQPVQRQFEKLYKPIWILVTYFNKYETIFKNNIRVQQLCNDYGLNNAEFKTFFDSLLKYLSDAQQSELNKIFQPIFATEKKPAEEISEELSETKEQSHVTKRKKPSTNKGVKQPLHENPGFDARIKQASARHIPKTSYFNYGFYSQSTEMSDASGKKYKLLTNKLAILPRKELSDAEAYQEGITIKQYLIDKCHLSANSEKNILVQPTKQGEKWQEENSYELTHNKQTIRFDYTIEPLAPIGIVVVRGYTILTIATHYHPSPTTDAKETDKNPVSTPTKKNKSDKTPSGQHISLLALASASSAQPQPSKLDDQEESTGDAHTPPLPPPNPAAKSSAPPANILRFSSALFRKSAEDAARTPTPYEVTTPVTPGPAAAQLPDSKPSSVLSSAATPSITKSQPSDDVIIDISDDDDETKELKQKLTEARQLLNKQEQQLAQAKIETAKQKSELIADKKRRQRESLDKLTADLAASQQALAAEQQLQERLKIMKAIKEQQATYSSITSPAPSGKM